MKVVFDTNVYIAWIRGRKYSYLLMDYKTQKYLSSVVLMELWAGAKTKHSTRIIEKLQKPYINAERVVTPSARDFIIAGRFISAVPGRYINKIQKSGFINDFYIALNAQSIGAVLYTENREDYMIIGNYIKGLKIEYL